jgi:hypothetical protein
MKGVKEFVQDIEKHFGDITHLRICYPDGTISMWRKIDGKFYAYKKQSSGPSPNIGKIKSTRSLYSRDQRKKD